MEELWANFKILLVELSHFKKRNRIQRYGLPIVLSIAVFLSKQYLHAFLGDNSAFLMVSFIVAASSWYGGLGPGIFATLISAFLTYFTYLTRDSATHPMIGDITVTAIFIIEGIMISLASEARFEVEDQKDEFIGFVAHEIKNPLASIKGFSGLIERSATISGHEKILSYSQQITRQSDRILEIINDLLDLTRIEIGKFPYTESFFNIGDLVREVVGQQRIIAADRIIEMSGRSKKMLYGDRYRIAQAVTNLVTNAIKYSPEHKKISVKIKETKNKVWVSVKDRGLGIGKNDHKKIFNRFYRTGAVQKNKSEGIGLGLFISSQIVNHHGGSLWVKSSLGKGSVFYLELPFGMRDKYERSPNTKISSALLRILT